MFLVPIMSRTLYEFPWPDVERGEESIRFLGRVFYFREIYFLGEWQGLLIHAFTADDEYLFFFLTM